MLPTKTHGRQGPLIVCLHWLGGSARSWNEVAEGLAAKGFQCVAIDLPGFGDAAGLGPQAPADAALSVIETIRALREADPAAPWLLAGHSMGGKIAALVARAAVEGAPGLQNLSALALASPSPPEPEPMTPARREELLATLGRSTGDAEEDRKRAATWADNSIGKLPLPPSVRDRTIADILRLNRAAFRNWVEVGSTLNLSAQVGVLPFPALIFAGDSERGLGPDTQRDVTLPHFAVGRVVVLKGSGHLSPLERPAQLVEHITDFALQLKLHLHPPQTVLSSNFETLLNSTRTASQTRAVMRQRLAADDAQPSPLLLTQAQRCTLRALVACVIPHAPFDLAARLERTLVASKGDGWRFDTLPTDAHAWQLGLDSLEAAAHRAHDANFIGLTTDLQHALLQQALEGKLGKGLFGTLGVGESSGLFTAAQMQQWFEDVRAELTRLYVADPRTMDRIGFSGFADEGGFTQIEPNQREAFEREEATTS